MHRITSIPILKLGIALFLLFPLIACQTLEPINLQVARQAEVKQIIGVWQGSWLADNGSSDSFELKIETVNEDGSVTGSRMYKTRLYGKNVVRTEGQIIDGQLHLDKGRGENVWIRLKMSKDPKTGELWLKGRYSTIGGGNIYLGDIRTKKIYSSVVSP